MESNLLIKLLSNSKWLQQHERFRKFLKSYAMLILKVATLNKGIKKRIGSMGGTFRFDYNFAFSDFQNWGAGHNNAFKTLLQLCEGKKVIFDLGAHIGLCSLPISKVVEEGGIVYAFEPSEINMHYLSRNIHYSSISNIRLIPFLVGDKNRLDVPFYESDYVAGMNSIVRYKNDGSYKLSNKRQVSIDDFCENNLIVPEVIKIDVEGAEIKVLEGAKNVLKKYRPIIVLSVHPKHLNLLGSSVENLKNIIAGLGYNILDINRQIVYDLGLREYVLEPLS